jgi:hypothetical protein
VIWPEPKPGLVIRYSYLWHREATTGQEEGTKDRPCAVVVALRSDAKRWRVYALPITHTQPAGDERAIEIPSVVKARLGLDGQRSWVVVTEVNRFLWPGPDLRFLPGKGPESSVYGFLPPGFFRAVREGFLAADRERKLVLVTRTE